MAEEAIFALLRSQVPIAAEGRQRHAEAAADKEAICTNFESPIVRMLVLSESRMRWKAVCPAWRAGSILQVQSRELVRRIPGILVDRIAAPAVTVKIGGPEGMAVPSVLACPVCCRWARVARESLTFHVPTR